MLRYLPNFVTVLRILLVAPICLAFIDQDYRLAFYLFVIAGISDGIDGLLARNFNWSTRLGSILDPLADKLLLVVNFVTLAWFGYMPWDLVIVIILRDIWILTGALVYHYQFGRYTITPSWPSKINTFLQITVVSIILFDLGIIQLPEPLLFLAMWLTFCSCVISWIDYTWVWGQRAWQQTQQKRLSI